MERQANYVLVGVIGVALIISAVVFVVWLAQFQFNQKYDEYRIYFHGPVSGLSTGGDVQFNGIKVGSITHIALDEVDPNKVITDIEVEEGTPVRVDSTAQTASLGITGVKYVQISAGSPSLPLLRKESRKKRPVIVARAGRMDDLVKDASRIAEGGADALEQVNKLLSDANIATLAASISDVQATTAELRARKTMFASMDRALGKLDRSATDLQYLLASTRGAFGNKDAGALGDIAAASAELRSSITDLHGVISKTDGSVAELANTTVPQMNAALASVQKAADQMDTLAFKLGQSPRSILTSAGTKEVEIPQ
jgi:phospholipid/cholesterol/gamma-HCH transport system substrate-binding protein